ncbi:MAG: hypothetical protein EPO24_01080 [Bacteroidetes bacterium]|nr:MAG: hypothetical protein EPO24_01080 [Bacteroidota bacterium]
MEIKELAIAWNWEYDADFISAIERECERRGITTFRIEESNLSEAIHAIESSGLPVSALFDRASDSDDRFVSLVNLLESRGTRIFNNYYLAERCRDKATMHLELMAAGLFVPHSLIIPPFYAQPMLMLAPKEAGAIGAPFVIKPANTTGGGFGVHLNAHTLMDIHLARQEHPRDKYLVQEKIYPKRIEESRAWFRVLYAFGESILCWWDDQTHVYREVSPMEELVYELSPLRNYIHTIRKICKLDFFSTEIALTADGKFVVVDYVNEVCDMRLRSQSFDGVPDEIVTRIVALLVNEVEITLHRSQVSD